jgi:hypothetical protein
MLRFCPWTSHEISRGLKGFASAHDQYCRSLARNQISQSNESKGESLLDFIPILILKAAYEYEKIGAMK